MGNKKISILLATYNGELYIKEQIDSIFNQTYKDWKLIFHDDNSTDTTVDIIRQYANKYPEKIIFIDDNISYGGPSQNFNSLMKHADTDYVMFCDQDDYWKKDKIKITFDKMKEVELKRGKSFPILVHTDLEVVDEKLKKIHSSMWKYQKLDQTIGNELKKIAVQNVITGCTMMINRSLIDLVDDIPKDAVMHDWWISIVACRDGLIVPVYNSTIKYRQHGNNRVGAVHVGIKHYLIKIFSIKKSFSDLNRIYKQTKLLKIRVNYLNFFLYKFSISLFKVLK